MSEISDFRIQVAQLQRDTGRLLGLTEQLIENGKARDERLQALEDKVEAAALNTAMRLGKVEETVKKMSGPVAEFMRLRRRASFAVGAAMMAFTAFMFVFGPAIPDLVRRALAWLATLGKS